MSKGSKVVMISGFCLLILCISSVLVYAPSDMSGGGPAGDTVSIDSSPAGSGVIGVAANDADNTRETDALHHTLDAFGFCWVDITSVPEYDTVEIQVIIAPYSSVTFSKADLDVWVQSGGGLIQLGDWTSYFPNDWIDILEHSTIPVNVVTSFPGLTDGLQSSWTATGFWYYGYDDEDYVGWVTDLGFPNIINADGHDRACTAEEVGDGRAVYIGWNVYGPAADSNSLRLFLNALRWCGARPCQPQPVGGIIVESKTLGMPAFWTSLVAIAASTATCTFILKRRKT